MNERLKLMGLLEEKRQEAAILKLRIEGLRDSIRDWLPRHESVENLRGDLVAAQAVELAALLSNYNDLLVEIRAIKADLGG